MDGKFVYTGVDPQGTAGWLEVRYWSMTMGLDTFFMAMLWNFTLRA